MSEEGYFLGYPSADLHGEETFFSIIPAPYEGTTTYVRGQAAAPSAILDASSQVGDYDEETSLTLVNDGIHVIHPDLAPTEDAALEEWVKLRMEEALAAHAVPIILGGEGIVSLWGIETLIRHTASRNGGEVSILHIDANADLNEAEQGEEDHHTVMRRVLELPPRPPNICQVGIRALSRDAWERIMDESQPVETFFMCDINRKPDDSWHNDVIETVNTPVYLSIDLTAFDPAVIPNVSNPEPGGFDWWPLLRLIKNVAARRRIAAIDITELCPREGLVRSDFAAARLLYKIMNYIKVSGKMLPKETS